MTGCSGPSTAPESAPPAKSMDFDPAATVFEIDPTASEARFSINEILRGEPTTVVGKTNQVQGQIAVNLNDLSTAAVGPIQVDAQTLVTDNSFRNRAIETRILLSRVFRYVTFAPTAVSGLPDSVSPGESMQFQIEGDLTIVETTKPVVFDVRAVAVSDSRIEGTAAATIQRAAFDLFVPSATGVAGVEEDVLLEIDFAAEAAD
jgi:polyisoprenoid-binding protein YceI